MAASEVQEVGWGLTRLMVSEVVAARFPCSASQGEERGGAVCGAVWCGGSAFRTAVSAKASAK